MSADMIGTSKIEANWISYTYNRKKSGPSIDLVGTPHFTVSRQVSFSL